MSPDRGKFLKRFKLSGYDRELLVFVTKSWGLSRKSTVRLSRDEVVWRLGPYRFVINDWVPY